MDWQAIYLSLKLALWVVAFLLPAGLVLAWFLVYGRFRGKVVLDALVSLPLVLPPTVLGFYLLVAMGPHSPLGRAWEAVMGCPLVFSFSGLVLASVFLNLPFFTQPFVAALSGVDRKLLEAAATLGARPAGIYVRVAMPLAWRGLVSGIIMTFAHAIGEFGVVLMVGGNLPGVTRTASIALFDQVQALDLKGANQTALFLLAVSFAVLLATSILRAKERPWS
ncbi:MAG TPA: molybdate ABC transporter permease subunit [Holophaga sp.]|nr:molybdate ABC transporter permease subunit [Holophaga sp.]